MAKAPDPPGKETFTQRRKWLAGKASSAPPKAQMDEVVAAFNAGRIEEAIRLATTLTQMYPDHPFGWTALGAAYQQAGHLEQSTSASKRAIAINPNDPQAHSNLGVVLKDLGRLEEAGQSYREAIRLKPDFPEVHSNLGNALRDLGRLEEAEQSYREAIRLKPDFHEAHYNLGNALKDLGRLEEAGQSYREAIRLKPDFPAAHSNLGNALRDLGRLDESEKACREAIRLKPDFPEAHSNLGNALFDLGRLDEAEKSYREAVRLKPDYHVAHSNLGNALRDLGRLDAAEKSYREAIRLKPDYHEAHSNLGTLARNRGDQPDAINRFKKALSIDSGDVQAFYNLTEVTSIRETDELVARMEALFSSSKSTPVNKIPAGFGLYNVYDKAKSFEKAFGFVSEANRLKRAWVKYDPSTITALTDRLFGNSELLSGTGLGIQDVRRGTTPVFVLGMPRSGTTLIEQILSTSPLCHGAGEIPTVAGLGSSIALNPARVTKENLAEFRLSYLEFLDQAKESSEQTFVINKTPANFLYIGLIFSALPEAKVIHTIRDPAAVCWSIYSMHFASRGMDYAYDLNDIIAYYSDYLRIMRFWDERFGNGIHHLDYDGFVQNPEVGTKRLIRYLGLPWTEQFLSPHENMRPVSTASTDQVRRPIYEGSSERWKRYQPYLDGKLDNLEKFKPIGG